MGAENAVTSCDLRVLVDQAAEPVASSDADVVVGRRDMGPAVGWSVADGPVRPVGVVVIDLFAERVVQMPSAGDEDPVGALAPRAGDPPLADRVRSRRLDGRLNDLDAVPLENRIRLVTCGSSGVRRRRATARPPLWPTLRWSAVRRQPARPPSSTGRSAPGAVGLTIGGQVESGGTSHKL